MNVAGHPTSNLVIEQSTVDLTLIRLYGEWDLANSPSLRQALLAGIASSQNVVVDLTHTEFVDSSVLHVLCRTSTLARDERKRLILALGPSSGAWRVLEITGVLRQLEHADDMDAALQALVTPEVA
jgi:anti-sigma B factor antagonist